jgi:hypothetical protein
MKPIQQVGVPSPVTPAEAKGYSGEGEEEKIMVFNKYIG